MLRWACRDAIVSCIILIASRNCIAGLSSVSGLSHPVQTVDDLDFKDTTSYNADHDFGMNDGNNYLPPDGKLDCVSHCFN